MADGAERDDCQTATSGPDVATHAPNAATGGATGAASGPARYLEPAAGPAAGDQLERYRIEGPLGRGGEGVVFAAHDPLLDRPVAIKLLRPERRTERERLLREGQAIARLRHPNVITVYDVGVHGDELFIAMELVRGANLRRWLGAAPRPWRAALATVLAAGRGLAAAHAAGLVHGDFKPENVLVADDGHVVVGDFGLARASEAAVLGGAVAAPPGLDLTDGGGTGFSEPGVTGAVAGTPAYLAPEQWRGQPSTAATDQFAFAVTLHEALFGQRPFERAGDDRSLAALATAVQRGRRAPLPAHDVPRHIVRALERALALEPAARFPSLDALLTALAPRRRRWVVPTVTAIVAGGAALALMFARDAARSDPRRAGCAQAAGQAARAWSPTARAAYLARHGDVPWVAEHAAWLDGFARDWASARSAVCLREAPLGATDPDAASACLERALEALRAAAARTAPGWPELPALRDCLAPPTVRPQSRSLAFGPQGYPTLSPDGAEVALTDFAGDAYVVRLDTPGRPRPIAGARELLDWLPDGSMYVARADRRYERVAVDGTITPLGRLDAFTPRGSQLSPDGRHVSFELPERVEIRATAGGAVLGVVGGSPSFTAWEPDGHRLALSLASGDVALFDVTDRTTVVVPVRTGVGPIGLRTLAWLRPGELVLSGELAEGERRVGLWSLAFDERSHLRAMPALRQVPEPSVGMMPGDARGTRLALETYSLKQRAYRWLAGRQVELPATLDYADVVAVDPARRRALLRRASELLELPLDGTATPVTIAAAPGVYAYRAGAIATLRPDGRGAWALTELADDAAPRVVAHLRWDVDDVTLACDQASAGHCVAVGRRDGVMHAAPLVGDHLGPEVALPGLRGGVAVSADGRRWVAVRVRDGAVVELDAATGAVRAVHVLFAGECHTFGAGWRAGVAGVWARYACADRFALVHGPIAGAYVPILESDGWMSGVAAFGADEYLYSVQDNGSHLLIIDGL